MVGGIIIEADPTRYETTSSTASTPRVMNLAALHRRAQQKPMWTIDDKQAGSCPKGFSRAMVGGIIVGASIAGVAKLTALHRRA